MTEYKDILGQELAVGDYVALMHSQEATPSIAQVVGFTPKSVKIRDTVSSMDSKRPPGGVLKLSDEAVVAHFDADVKDALGQKLAVGDYAFGSNGEYIEPVIYEVTGFWYSKVVTKRVSGANSYKKNMSGHDLIKIDDPTLLTLKILTGK